MADQPESDRHLGHDLQDELDKLRRLPSRPGTQPFGAAMDPFSDVDSLDAAAQRAAAATAARQATEAKAISADPPLPDPAQRARYRSDLRNPRPLLRPEFGRAAKIVVIMLLGFLILAYAFPFWS